MAQAQTVNIDFDHFANGTVMPTTAALFVGTSPLTSLYSSLGLTFSGPAANQGGAILDDRSNFGIAARSGRNFLAFNRDSQDLYPQDPETITFSSAASSVSIFAGSQSSNTFLMQAFDSANTLLTSTSVVNTAGQYTLLSVAASGIQHVVLTSIAGAPIFVYDDLSVDFGSTTPSAAPEPGSLALLLPLIVGIGGVLKRRKN